MEEVLPVVACLISMFSSLSSKPSPLIVYATCPYDGMHVVGGLGKISDFARRGDVSPGQSVCSAISSAADYFSNLKEILLKPKPVRY